MSSLAYDLHVLVRTLDRSAETRLAPFGISYARYLAMVIVADHEGLTQRDLATALGQSEPTASRTASALAEAGWLEAERIPGAGNRRVLTLTSAGHELLRRSGTALGSAFDEVARAVGHDPDALAADVRRMTAIIEDAP
ncbi:MarR family winged helix-turn-helix transcriptional regulator [Janibacter alittae]|uniref:MarR family transcriptional regulator n=1 Tax=Janibacter alittae TaxID=3115209 RepID=A0ABZ2ME63_9MICO